MTFVDRMFLKWHSETAMSSAFTASLVWFAVLSLPLGICSYSNTFVSQYFGDHRPRRIGPSAWQGVWAALVSSPFVLMAIPIAPWIFGLANHGQIAVHEETLYFQIICVGGPGMLVAQALSSFYSGRGRTIIVMGVDTGVTVVNLVLDYLWIFGHAGFPEMGIAGAAWATVFSLWLKAAIYVVLILQRDHRQQYCTLSGMRFDRQLFGRLIYFGGPSGIQMLLDVLGFTVFAVMIGRLGEVAREATTMAFSISTVAFMPIWGFGMAVGILVGQRLGEDRDDLAARATWTTLVIAMTYMVLVSAFYVLVPDLFLYGFFAGSNGPSAQQVELRTMATNLLRYVAAYNLFDALLIIFVSAIKGSGDTRFVLQVSIVMALLLAGLSWFCIEQLRWGVYASWTLVTLWVWVMGVAFLLRFLQGSWRSMRVIEGHD